MQAAERLQELKAGYLTLLNNSRQFSGGADWRVLGDRRHNRLWTYNLHDHRWLMDLAPAVTGDQGDEYSQWLERVLADWMKSCLVGSNGFTHFPWNSYTIATRLGVWVKLYGMVAAKFWERRPAFTSEYLQNFAEQATYLYDHLEWDLRGNHLLRDAVGLGWATRFLHGKNNHHWRKKAIELTDQQVQEQILPDGGHFERSPMYHIHYMEDLTSLLYLLQDSPGEDERVESWRAAWALMAESLAWLRHPDGEIPLFNDSAFNGASSPKEILQFGRSIGCPIDMKRRSGAKSLGHTGLIIWQGEKWSLFFDVGAVGPDYQPGHAHADTLAIETSFKAKRLFVDPGTNAYDYDQKRIYDRSTKSHNTVCIDSKDSSEVWHIFRVGQRARPKVLEMSIERDGLTAIAEHNGYRRLNDSPTHRRQVSVSEVGPLVVEDYVEGGKSAQHNIQGGLLVEPGWHVSEAESGWNLRQGDALVRVNIAGPEGHTRFIEDCAYHPEFGRELITKRLHWRYYGYLPCRFYIEING